MQYRNREQAARLLAERLVALRGKHPLVLAIPRGAVPMARLIADQLDGEIDVVLVRKLGSPGNPEFAIGSVDETGATYIAEYAAATGGTARYIAAEKQRQLAVMRQRRAQYTPVRPPIDPAGRIAVVVDDGLATGATMIAALHAIRMRKPARLICAVPVAPPDTLEKIAPLADQVICLLTPEYFYAVGQFYMSFPQVTDEEVVKILAESMQESTDAVT